jgi:hypothetical protein
MRADLNGHAAGDFRHRLQQRKRTIASGHRLVSDAGGAGLHQAFRLRLVGSQMEIGEEEVPAFQKCDFLLLRLLDLHDHVGGCEGLLRAGGDARPRVDIILVFEIDAHARLRLDDDFMPRRHQLGYRWWGKADPIFVYFDFLGNADAHLRLHSCFVCASIEGPSGFVSVARALALC